MASVVFSFVQNLWPLSFTKEDDLKASAKLVAQLPIPEHTKQFVFALREPDTQTVVYLLAVQNLSEESALDVKFLVKGAQPKAVIAQIAPAAIEDVQTEAKCLADQQNNTVPASTFEVLKRCFIEKINKDQYQKIAGYQLLQEIFGVGLFGHVLAAKEAAEEVDSCFLLLESPYERNCDAGRSGDVGSPEQGAAVQLQGACLIPGSANSVIGSNVRKICLIDAVEAPIVRSLTPSFDVLLSQANLSDGSTLELKEPSCTPVAGYEPPPFAQAVYPLLADLYNVFADIPSLGKAMFSAQAMLDCVQEGEPVSSEILCDVYIFRIAIEGLRMALNNAGRSRMDVSVNNDSTKAGFCDLTSREKSDVLLVQALRSQARKFGSTVAIVDASCLAGIRRHWNTPAPPAITYMSSLSLKNYGDDDDDGNDDEDLLPVDLQQPEKKGLLVDKPMVVVGAGASAILGASSLSKAFHASALFKLAAYKAPLALKFSLTQLYRNAAVGMSKIFVPTKFFSPGFAGVGGKSSFLHFTPSAEKIRAVTHTVISSAERTSLMAMRTAFYEIMKKRRTQPFRLAPLITFGLSLAAGVNLVMHGDGIECVAESAPSIPMIASWGRGLENLRVTSEELRRTSGLKIKERLEAFMSSLNKSHK